MKGLFAIITKAQSSIFSFSNKVEEGLSCLLHRGKHQKHILISRNANDNPYIGLGVCSHQSEETTQICFLDYIYIVFDGKLHNVKSIKETYPDLAYCQTDEVLIAHAYHLLDEKAFSLFEGYWSFILVDTRKEKTYALRDTFGNRPLFYCETDEFVAFSSEIRPIYKLSPSVRSINRDAVMDFLLWGDIVKHKQDFFSDIHELPPAHLVSYASIDQSCDKKPYYTLSYKSCLGRYEDRKVPDMLETIKQLFFKGIESHVGDKNRIAVGLSGGLDSSCICCSVAELYKDMPITAFTAVNEYNAGETLWAEKIIKHVNAQWVRVSCTSEQLMEELEQINFCQNIPIFNTSSFAQYRIMTAAKQQGFTSIIDGQGSDEMFAGYTTYFQKFINELFSEWLFSEGVNECKHLSNAELSCKMIAQISCKEFIKKDILTEKLFANMTRKFILKSVSLDKQKQYFHRAKERRESKETLNDYLFESYTKFLPHSLRWGEHSAASVGIDCLMPFSNNRALAEYVFDLPSIYKIHDGWGKHLLRNAMKNVVPEEVRMRKQKMGFYTPEDHWLQAISSQMKSRIIDIPDKENIINKEGLCNQWDDLFRLENVQFKQFAFRCLSYLVWLNTWE